MKQFFEGIRRWSALNEEQILAEGRLDDAKKKYSQVDPLWIDRLSERDPSGNNKYLMWAAKQFAQITEPWRKKHADSGSDQWAVETAQEIYSAYRTVGDAVDKFHASHQRLKNRDLNAYKTVDDVLSAVRQLGLTQRQKRRKNREIAKEGSTNIFENDDFWMIRPDTAEASCYYGQGTKWCISARQSQNYFNQYTGDGKSFYMVMMKNLDEADDGRKVALVYDKDAYGDLDPEEIYDAVDDSIGEDDFFAHVIKNIIGAHFADYEEIYEEIEEFHAAPDEENLTENIKKLAEEMMKSGAYDSEIEEQDITTPNPEELEEAMRMVFHNANQELFASAAYHNEENPAGPREEDYQELLDAANLTNIYVTFDMYDEGQYYWDGGTSWELPDDLVFANDDDGNETDFDDWEDEILDIFREAADENYIYPEDAEADSYGSNSIRMQFRPDYGEASGVEGFKSFLSTMESYESHYEDVLELALENMKEQGITISEDYEKKKEIFRKLSKVKMKNFDISFSKGKIEFEQKTPSEIQIPIARALNVDGMKTPEPRDSSRNIADDADRKDWIKNQLRQMRTDGQSFLKHAFNTTWPLAYDSAKESGKQGEMFMNEAVLYGEHRDPIQGNWVTYDVDLDDGGTLTTQLRIERVPVDDLRALQYMAWLDKNLDIFHDALAAEVIRGAQERTRIAKQHWPEKYNDDAQEETQEATNENISYGKLHENWKRWATK
jgi:hypothetical protein